MADLNAGTRKITNVVDPEEDQDVATKKYVDDNAGGASLTCSENFLVADVAMTNANQYYDGPSLSLAAGTWLLMGQVLCTASGTVTAKLWDGTTVYASGEQSSPGAGASIVFPFSKKVVLGSTTTVKISCRNNLTGGNIRYRSPVVDTSATNATGLTALQIA